MTLVDDAHGGQQWPDETGRALFVDPTADAAVAVGQRGPDFAAVAQDPGFGELRRRQRRFVFPVSVLFMVWYFTFVLLAAYAHGFMSRPVLGLINMGMVLGLAQFVTTLLIMWAYTTYANRTLDPATEAVVRADRRRAEAREAAEREPGAPRARRAGRSPAAGLQAEGRRR